ncbi:MAG: toxin-antitoxin system, antitoxin component, Xre family protein [Acidobacteriota bacterium]
MQEQGLIEKIRKLPPEKQGEVEDFVDFLTLRDEDSRLTQGAARLSEEAFRQVWDNEADSAYDQL